MDLLEKMQETRFLGQEFLTWVWYRSEINSQLLDIPGTGPVEVWFEDRLSLESGSGNSKQQVTCQGKDLDLAEARTALKEGKKVSQARLRLGVDGQEWRVTLKAEGLELGSVKTPKTLDPDEEEPEGLNGRLLERVALTQVVIRILDGLYSDFIQVRLGETWEKDELPRIRRWLRADGN
jgi:recombination associated protein RdgC